MNSADVSRLGRYGVFCYLIYLKPAVRDESARELEELGFGAIWLANATSEETEPVLAATSTIAVGTAVQSVWRREAAQTRDDYAELEAKHPGRLFLGLGVSHPQTTEGYARPYPKMVSYLDELDATEGGTAVPVERRVLAALGPKMTGLARDRAAGAMPYLVTADQVASAREALGERTLLAPELGIILESDAGRARTLARGALERYLTLSNYTDNWLRGGFTREDLADGGSDRLVDALFAWGDDDRVRARIEGFLAAGADHVVLQPVDDKTGGSRTSDGLRRLAALLP